MEKKKIENTPLDRTDSYLRTQRVRVWVVILGVLVFASGVLIWLFFGSRNVTVSGYASIAGNVEACCLVPSQDIDKVSAGMTVWINNTRGTVTEIKDQYLDYSQILFMYGNSIGNLNIQEDEVYYPVYSDIVKEKSDYGKFTIITKTVTPFVYYFGGTDK